MTLPRPAFDAAQRQALERLLRERSDATGPLPCPACGGSLIERPVPAPPDLPYVRHRVLFICPACRRSSAIEGR